MKMSKFKIEVISKKPEVIDGLLSHTGEITMGDYKETFVMPLNSWTIEDYKQQWKEGLERIKTHDRSCLVNLIQNMDANPMVEMWVLFKVDDIVYIGQRLLNRQLAGEFNYPIKFTNFNKENCYQFIHDRIVNENGHGIAEDGDEISEWKVSLSAFDHY